MSLTKPNQDLRRDLKQAAALLKWSGVDLLQVDEAIRGRTRKRRTGAHEDRREFPRNRGSADVACG
ncbi:hypothetical protein D3C81_1759620 [compost metagenome]